jgi:hypothetical protein
MYWMYMGSCRRQDDTGDCPYHHRDEDKGSRYGDPMPDYVLGKGGNRNRATSLANWNIGYRQWDEEPKCQCGKPLAACGACGKGYAQSAQWSDDREEGNVWSAWEATTAPAPEDPAVQRDRERSELKLVSAGIQGRRGID